MWMMRKICDTLGNGTQSNFEVYMRKAVVIGAGPAGLTAAYELVEGRGY